jgi:hypothetical protein
MGPAAGYPCAYSVAACHCPAPFVLIRVFAFVFFLASQCTRRVRQRARGKLTDKGREAADRSETGSGDTDIAFWFRGLCLQNSSQRFIMAIVGWVTYNKTPFFFFFFLVISFVVHASSSCSSAAACCYNYDYSVICSSTGPSLLLPLGYPVNVLIQTDDACTWTSCNGFDMSVQMLMFLAEGSTTMLLQLSSMPVLP